MFLSVVQIFSALVMFAALAQTMSIFTAMWNGTDERNSIPYLVINIIATGMAATVYVYLNYLM